MYNTLQDLIGCQIDARDDKIGIVKNVYFDDHKWQARYVVVDTSKFLPGARVLISTDVLDCPDVESKTIPASLTTQQVTDSPGVESDLPVSRESERLLAEHYGWAPYWQDATMSESLSKAVGSETPTEGREKAESLAQSTLRSAEEVIGYAIHATDGRIGHVHDFVLKTDEWKVQFMIVDTGDWLPGEKIIADVAWLRRVDWAKREVFIEQPCDKIESSPKFDPSRALAECLADLRDHYGQSGG